MSQTPVSSEIGGLTNADQHMITDIEKDTLGEIGNICMGTSATTLSELLGKRVTITTPRVSLIKGNEYLADYEKPVVVTEVSYTKGIDGFSIFLIKKDDALAITEVLMGTTVGADELYLSAISEVMNQMVGSSSTALADILHVSVNISPPVIRELSPTSEVEGPSDEMLIRTSFVLDIEGLLKSSILQIMPFGFGKKLAATLIGEESGVKAMPQPAARQAEGPAARQAEGPAPYQAQGGDMTQRQQDGVQSMENNEEKIELKAVKFQSFNDKGDFTSAEFGRSNMDLIIDVPLHVTVVLGKAKRSIKEILELNRGSVVVLDRFAGEMVDVLVNGKVFARGEVVVIDENYGVRITELIPVDHAKDA